VSGFSISAFDPGQRKEKMTPRRLGPKPASVHHVARGVDPSRSRKDRGGTLAAVLSGPGEEGLAGTNTSRAEIQGLLEGLAKTQAPKARTATQVGHREARLRNDDFALGESGKKDKKASPIPRTRIEINRKGKFVKIVSGRNEVKRRRSSTIVGGAWGKQKRGRAHPPQR